MELNLRRNAEFISSIDLSKSVRILLNSFPGLFDQQV
jgi:hypothetical protein